METSDRRTWFTWQRMKRIAIGIIAVDLFLIAFWYAGSVYISLNFTVPCFKAAAISHFLILIHFALGMYICNMESIISTAENEARERGQRLKRLPYQAYGLLAWSFTATVSTLGDLTLLTWAIQDVQENPAGSDQCDTARILHATFDALALFVSVITVVWFILFTSCTVRRRPVDKQVIAQ